MGMLYFDVGNTQIKWLYETANGTEYGFAPSEKIGASWLVDLERLVEAPGGIAISCVKSPDYQSKLVGLLKGVYGVDPYVAQVEKAACGMVCSYEDPRRMGVDRWLAMISVRSQVEGAFCVIDCGSAVTFDWVNAEGVHLGGFILSGLKLSVKALLEGTDQVIVDFDRLQYAGIEPGKDTTDAVYNGAVFGLVSQVEAAYEKLQKLAVNGKSTLILTGGDAKLLSDKLNAPHQLVDKLVFDGLKTVYAASKG